MKWFRGNEMQANSFVHIPMYDYLSRPSLYQYSVLEILINKAFKYCIQLTSLSFLVNQPSHSWNMAIKNFTLKIQSQGHEWGQS